MLYINHLRFACISEQIIMKKDFVSEQFILPSKAKEYYKITQYGTEDNVAMISATALTRGKS